MIVFGLSNNIYSPLANRKAWLLAFERPSSLLLAITCTSGNSQSISSDLSVEALSTTKTSYAIPWAALNKEVKASRSSFLEL